MEQATATQVDDESLARELAALDEPRSHLLEYGSASLRARIWGNQGVHRIVPDRVALALARLRGTLWWATSTRRREAAVQDLTIVLSGTPREGEAPALARKYLQACALRREVRWRPWIAKRSELLGVDHLEAAQAAGRGVILMLCHIGTATMQVYPLLARGYRVYMVGGHWLFTGPYNGVSGRGSLQLFRRFEAAGGRGIAPGGKFELLEALLRGGSVCAIAFDVPGSLDVSFLFKRARMRSGLPKLAMATGAPVVPLFARLRGRHQQIELVEPVWPERFSDLSAFSAQLARVMTRAVLERPEEYDPNFVRDLWPNA